MLVWQARRLLRGALLRRHGLHPEDIYEAAALDGARPGARLFFRITLPLLWDTIQVAWVYLGIAALRRVRPRVGAHRPRQRRARRRRRRSWPLEIYRNAFQYCQFGYASAMGVALFFLTITFAALTLRLTRRERIEF